MPRTPGATVDVTTTWADVAVNGTAFQIVAPAHTMVSNQLRLVLVGSSGDGALIADGAALRVSAP